MRGAPLSRIDSNPILQLAARPCVSAREKLVEYREKLSQFKADVSANHLTTETSFTARSVTSPGVWYCHPVFLALGWCVPVKLSCSRGVDNYSAVGMFCAAGTFSAVGMLFAAGLFVDFSSAAHIFSAVGLVSTVAIFPSFAMSPILAMFR